jgi:hypothetical protein
MRISFIWQEVTERKDFWNDGLREAMRIIEKDHTVTYHEPWDDITEADIILYWEAPCTINGSNAPHYIKVRDNAIPKALLFAGGPLNAKDVEGFDHLFVESDINAKECQEQGIPYSVAFGINDTIFKPKKKKKKWKAIHPGTCASWKRQWLVAEAFGKDALLVGRRQATDTMPFDKAEQLGTEIIDEVSIETVVDYLNQSEVLCQTSDYWGGGQRATLEAMACGIPVICMEDSPKNREYIEACGAGLFCKPSKEQIVKTYNEIQTWTSQEKQRGIQYIQDNWTAQHYADNLLQGIQEICNSNI